MSSAKLLPPNTTAAEAALEQAVAGLAALPVPIRESWNADTCPEALLPWLARALSVDTWQPQWTTAQKRRVIKTSLEVHRRKGTIGAVRDALRALGFDARVQEWNNQIPPGEPYTYKLLLEADQAGYQMADLQLLLEMVDSSKNLRSHLTEITSTVRTQSTLVLAAVASLGSEVTLLSSIAQEISIVPGFMPAEALINELLNTQLPQAIGD